MNFNQISDEDLTISMDMWLENGEECEGIECDQCPITYIDKNEDPQAFTHDGARLPEYRCWTFQNWNKAEILRRGIEDQLEQDLDDFEHIE